MLVIDINLKFQKKAYLQMAAIQNVFEQSYF